VDSLTLTRGCCGFALGGRSRLPREASAETSRPCPHSRWTPPCPLRPKLPSHNSPVLWGSQARRRSPGTNKNTAACCGNGAVRRPLPLVARRRRRASRLTYPSFTPSDNRHDLCDTNGSRVFLRCNAPRCRRGRRCRIAFGLIASAIWLHIVPPAQSAPLIAAFAILIQGTTLWKLRLWPYTATLALEQKWMSAERGYYRFAPAPLPTTARKRRSSSAASASSQSRSVTTIGSRDASFG
jgi:hypothetical protein